jgi:hypothetical protein
VPVWVSVITIASEGMMPTYEAGDYVQVEFQDETMFSRAMFFALETRREQNIQLTSVRRSFGEPI